MDDDVNNLFNSINEDDLESEMPTLASMESSMPGNSRSSSVMSYEAPAAAPPKCTRAPRNKKRKRVVDESSEDSSEGTTPELFDVPDSEEDPEYNSDSSYNSVTAARKRKTRKAAPKSYNERAFAKNQELKAIIINEESEKRKRGRPRKSTGDPPNLHEYAPRPTAPKFSRGTFKNETLRSITKRFEPPSEHDNLFNFGFRQLLPAPKYPSVDISTELRLFISKVESTDLIQSASGGFLLFIGAITDGVLLQLFENVQKSFVLTGDDDFRKLSQVLRFMWNMMAEDVRLKWELNARKIIRLQARTKRSIKSKNGVTEKTESEESKDLKEIEEEKEKDETLSDAEVTMDVDEKESKDKENVDSEDMEVEEINGQKNSSARPSPAPSSGRSTPGLTKKRSSPMIDTKGLDADSFTRMPHCEQTFIAGGIERHRSDKLAVWCPLCEEGAREEMYTFTELITHVISQHFAGIHYGCQFCGMTFSTVDGLRTHRDCQPFSTYMLNRLLSVGPDASTLTMQTCFVFLGCSECGLLVPLKASFDTDGSVAQFKAQWVLLIRILSHHNCDSLLPIIVYMPETPDPNLEELRFPIVPSGPLREIPICCSKCGIDEFATPQESEDHFLNEHSEGVLDCKECGKKFGTSAFFITHCLGHLPSSVILADYLANSCRFFPPPGDECSAPRLGFKLSAMQQKIALGGTGTLNRGFIVQQAHPFENTLFPKLMNAEIVKQNEEREKIIRSEKGETEEMEEDFNSDEDGDKKYPIDLGYDHVGRHWLEETPEENQIRMLASDYFEMSDDSKVLLVTEQTRLVDYKEIEKQLQLKKGLPDDRRVTPELVTKCDFARLLLDHASRIYSIPLNKGIGQYDTTMISEFMLTNERVYYCNCGTICKGSESIQHAISCFMSGEIVNIDFEMCDEISLIYSPFWPSDSRLYCRLCEDSACGITGLRAHMLMEHLIYSPYVRSAELMPPMSDLSKSIIYRTMSAQILDDSLGMQPDGMLARNANPYCRPVIPPYGGQQSNSGANSLKPAVKYNSNLLPSIQDRSHAASKLDSEKPPFDYIRKGNNGFYNCTSCSFICAQPQLLCNHVEQDHCKICKGCGLVFVKPTFLAKHYRMCSRRLAGKDLANISARCPICKTFGKILEVIKHIAMTHYASLRVNKFSGHLGPDPIELEYVPQSRIHEMEELPHAQPPKTPEVVAVIYDAPKTKLSCLLCGMHFVNSFQYHRHLARHTETWSHCPLCYVQYHKYYKIDSILDMPGHILQQHTERRGTDNFCKFCFKRLHGDHPWSHLIYECFKTKICLQCPTDEETGMYEFTSVDLAQKHRRVVHERDGCTMNRFMCSLCKDRTYHLGNLEKGHSCNATNVPHTCACNNGEVFANRFEFYEHFDKTHSGGSLMCRLPACSLQFHHQKEYSIHRNQHFKTLVDGSAKEIYLLDQSLLVEEETEEERADREKIEAVKRQQKEDRIFEREITNMLKDTIKSVVVELGEEWIDVTTPIPSPSSVEGSEDDCIVLDDDGPVTPPADAAHLQLPREERPDSHPGCGEGGKYFEDDDADEIGAVVVQPSVPTVREIVDENGDDDLCVVAEVEHPAGTLPSVIASTVQRQRIKCPKCSTTFVTKGSLQVHLETAHKFDAGGTCLEDYGVPKDLIVFICRTCCVAFETSRQYTIHQREHNTTTQYSCDLCAMVSYNAQLVSIHLQSHADKKITYGCHECKLLFGEDYLLYGHLQDVHNVPLLFFCKKCNLGSTNGSVIAEHIKKRQCALLMQLRSNKSPDLQFGVVPANMVHYNPSNESQHKAGLQNGKIDAVVPSTCSHRTFVAPSGPMVSCGDCRCLMNLARFIAEEQAKNNGTEPDTRYERIYDIDAPQKKYLGLSSMFNQVRKGTVGGKTYSYTIPNRQSPLPVRAAVPHGHATINRPGGYSTSPRILSNGISGYAPNMYPATRTVVNAAPLQQLRYSGPNLMNSLNAGHSANAPVYQHHLRRPSQSATVHIAAKPLPVAKIPQSVGLASASSPRRPVNSLPSHPPLRVRPPIVQRPHPDVVDLSDDDEAKATANDEITIEDDEPSTSKNGVAVASKVNVKNKIGEKCKVCDKRITTPQILLLHDLHLNGHQYFCLDCPKTIPDERAAVEHIYRCHVKPAMTTKGDSFKPMIVDLNCPFKECSFSGSSLNMLKNHLMNKHPLAHNGDHCSMSFTSSEKCTEHNKKHQELEESGAPDSNCCLLCGTLDTWQKKVKDIPHTLAHTAIHGVKRYYMCRECSVCFKTDATGRKFVRHYEQEHITKVPGSNTKIFCKMCKEEINKEDLAEHAKSKHYVYGFKKRTCAEEGQLVVKSGALMRMFLGLEKIYYPDDASDVD